MPIPSATTLKKSLNAVPTLGSNQGAVGQFVNTLLAAWPITSAPPTGPQFDPTNNIVTVNQVNIGNFLRIRATLDGGTLDVLGVDNNWHTQLQWTRTKPS